MFERLFRESTDCKMFLWRMNSPEPECFFRMNWPWASGSSSPRADWACRVWQEASLGESSSSPCSTVIFCVCLTMSSSTGGFLVGFSSCCRGKLWQQALSNFSILRFVRSAVSHSSKLYTSNNVVIFFFLAWALYCVEKNWLPDCLGDMK